jgi:hypothetical protein
MTVMQFILSVSDWFIALLVYFGRRRIRKETGNKRQGTRDREQETGNKRQGTRDREQETGNKRQEKKQVRIN